MDSKHNPPCIDCITKPICVARLQGKTMMHLMSLTYKCSLLDAYLKPKDKDGKPIGNISLVNDVEKILCKNINYNPEPF